MNAYRLKPLSFPWPPFVYGLAIAAAFAFHHIAGLPTHLHATMSWLAGVLLIALGLWLDIWATKVLVESCTTILPHRGTSHLVTRGPYRFTRNPNYLGYTIMTAGIGLLTSNAWFFVMATLAAICTTMVAIRREERHLHARFGVEFEQYCKRTRRWI